MSSNTKFQLTTRQRINHPNEFSQMIETDVFDKSEFDRQEVSLCGMIN